MRVLGHFRELRLCSGVGNLGVSLSGTLCSIVTTTTSISLLSTVSRDTQYTYINTQTLVCLQSSKSVRDSGAVLYFQNTDPPNGPGNGCRRGGGSLTSRHWLSRFPGTYLHTDATEGATVDSTAGSTGRQRLGLGKRKRHWSPRVCGRLPFLQSQSITHSLTFPFDSLGDYRETSVTSRPSRRNLRKREAPTPSLWVVKRGTAFRTVSARCRDASTSC